MNEASLSTQIEVSVISKPFYHPDSFLTHGSLVWITDFLFNFSLRLGGTGGPTVLSNREVSFDWGSRSVSRGSAPHPGPYREGSAPATPGMGIWRGLRPHLQIPIIFQYIMAANTNTLLLRSVLAKDKLNGLNFLDWFRNLRIVLKQEQKLYVIEKPLPDEPPANASRADKDAYKKHLDEMVDVGCLMLATMNPELQKQHDMIEHLKELYQGQARQERFDISKALFQCKLAEGSPVGPHVLKMIGYIESLSKLGFPLIQELATDVILQSLSDSYSQFILNFNMNEIDKTLPQLLSMLRTAESNMKKVGPKPILMVRNNKGKGKAKVPTKPKGKGKPNLGKGKATLKPKCGVSKEGNCFHCGVTGHWKRNCPVYLKEIKKAKASRTSALGIYVIDINLSTTTSWVLDTGCGSHICTSVQGLQRSRTLARGDVDLRVGNGARVAASAMGTYTLSFPSGLGKMTKSPFTGKSERASDLLGLIHSDVCGPINTQAKGGFHYFITFTEDFSRYGYVYLMGHKSEALEKFKEFKNEVQNQLGKTIKTLRSDRGGEYLSLEFDDLLKECGIVSQLTPPGTPQWNGVSERRNRTLLDMVRSMMSHADLPTSFWGHALETTIFTLNRVPSKSVQKMPYEMWTGKRPSMYFMKIWGRKAYVKRQTSTKREPKSERCIFVGYLKQTKGYYFFNPTENKVFIARTGVFLKREFVSRKGSGRKIELEEIRESQDTTEPEIKQQQIPQEIEEQVTAVETQPPRRSLRECHAPERYGFLIATHGEILLIDQDEPRTYQEAVASPNSEKWLEAMRSEMDSIYENQVWTLVDPPEGASGFSKRKPTWMMDVKTAFLNGKLEEDVYMAQPEGFVYPKDAGKICKLQRSIYGLKQASRSWNLRFNDAIKEFGFIKNEDEPFVYKKVSGNTITFLVLYVDDILIMGNDIPTLQFVKIWLGSCFSMKDLGEATYILGVKIYRDRSRRLLGLSQGTYIDKVLKRFNMEESKRGFLPMRHGISLSKEMCPSTPQERERMSKIPYASAIGSIMYAMLCTRPDVSYASSLTSRYQVDPGEGHWTTIKNILKYLRRTKDTFLIYGGEEELSVKGYTDASFQTDKDDSRSQSDFVFCLNDGAVSWKSSKQSTVADSTTEAEYIAASEAAKEAVWIKKFITELGVVPSISDAIELRCDNNGDIAQAKEPRSHQRSKHILRRYHLIREIIDRGDVEICRVPTDDNIADPLTKPLT
ncbi:hypothetical protein CXB51_005003 [Gossypium anomalum]|uniref:Gag/pol protein n=1 Tax=Gossypium anomalum TaxID=47600 RepID=A0A8J6DBN2_9ROSI|nr:hypothetical protein CXB51_005003 [Gossypium anomalum]